LSDVAVSVLSPITSEMKRMLDDLAYVDGVLAKGAARANAIAQSHMAEIKDIVGFLHP
jgi:tryptophanyl-tRNA synthetase